MKITVDLPDELVHTIKLKAVNERRKFKDIMADHLLAALSGGVSPPNRSVGKDSLPLLKGGRDGCPQVTGWSARRMSDWIKEQAAETKIAP